jgi:ATP-binding cassette subfamily B protein
VIRLNRDVSLRLNYDFLSHILRLPLRFFETRATGDITARLSDGMRIQKVFLEGAGTALIDGTILIGSLAFLLTTAPLLGVLAAAAIPIYGLVTAGAVRALQRDHGQAMSSFARVEGSYLDSLGSIEAIAGFGVANAFVRTNAAHFGTFQESVEALSIRHARLSLLVDLFGGGLAIVTLVWGALLVVQGELLIGSLIAGYTLLVGILPSVARIIQGIVSFQEASTAASRLRDLLLTPTEKWDGGSGLAEIQTIELIRGKVEWSDGTRPFDEASLLLHKGEMVGLIGTNGSGKSTIIRILGRSLTLSGGSLLVNDIPAETTSLSDYRARVILLPNEVRIIGGTLADNVLFGRNVRGIEVLEALVDRLGLGSFMERFRDRWATRIGEGGRRISSGERQIIGLMRALLIPPDLLLVDEGIGSTDEGNTALVLEALRAFSRSMMVLVVSHDSRVHAVVDRLYRFSDGRIVPTDHESTETVPFLASRQPATGLRHRRPHVVP